MSKYKGGWYSWAYCWLLLAPWFMYKYIHVYSFLLLSYNIHSSKPHLEKKNMWSDNKGKIQLDIVLTVTYTLRSNIRMMLSRLCTSSRRPLWWRVRQFMGTSFSSGSRIFLNNVQSLSQPVKCQYNVNTHEFNLHYFSILH